MFAKETFLIFSVPTKKNNISLQLAECNLLGIAKCELEIGDLVTFLEHNRTKRAAVYSFGGYGM